VTAWILKAGRLLAPGEGGGTEVELGFYTLVECVCTPASEESVPPFQAARSSLVEHHQHSPSPLQTCSALETTCGITLACRGGPARADSLSLPSSQGVDQPLVWCAPVMEPAAKRPCLCRSEFRQGPAL
jgi:hypothetical protein